MFVLSHRLTDVALMSLQTGTAVAQTTGAIIDPRRLHIVAFSCEGRTLDVKPAIIHTNDIREVSDIGFIIDNSDAIMDPKELVRLKEIIDFHFQLPGIRVVDNHGKKLGTVTDYATDTLSFLIHKLHVKRPLLTSLGTAELIVDRSQIIEVTNKQIVVRAATAEEKNSIPMVVSMQPFNNPFRKPQAGMTDRNQSG